MLTKLNLTRKKNAPSRQKGNRTGPTTARLLLANDSRHPLKDMIFIDESGINLAMTRLFARAPKGERAHGKRPTKRGQNVSLIGARGLEGVITQIALLGATDGLTFEAFVAQKLVPKLWPGACVIMDNCSIHLGEEIETLIKGAGARLIYLPPRRNPVTTWHILLWMVCY